MTYDSKVKDFWLKGQGQTNLTVLWLLVHKLQRSFRTLGQCDIALALNGFLTSYSPSITKVNVMCTISVGVYNNDTNKLTLFNTTYLKKGWANSVNPDKMAHMSHLVWTYTVCLLILLFSQSFFLNLSYTHFYRMDSFTLKVDEFTSVN